MSQPFYLDGATVFIEIYRLEESKGWTLEIEDEYHNTTLWEDEFSADTAAFDEAQIAIKSQGIRSFIGPEDGKGTW
ncbi:hypothetical protein [Ruficoccus sp. ZRK36]|uniref:hypothetical protein n=1 Tax=Ruficoccus sp. ZRK36 TaxID=2866311 RepID=UPI001C735399|nr:hypothetical protein [Ruficoccus sp. ZRK36]QYY37319.1 hypothetical protein K0V07_07490 [Ruficoccus sp. ZRK36]